MKRIIAVTALAVSLAAGSFAGGAWWAHRPGAAHGSAYAATGYTCPMHPDYHSDRPGNCPICGMPLKAVRAGAATGGDAAARALPHGAGAISTLAAIMKLAIRSRALFCSITLSSLTLP